MSKAVESIDDLTPLRKNPRKRTERSHATIVRSLEEFGAARSIVIDEEGTVLAGNGTVEAAAELGITRLRVVETDGTELIAVRRTNLSAEEKQRYVIADNRSSELSEWDAPLLVSMAQELDLGEFWQPDELQPLLDETIAQLEEEQQKPERKPRTVSCPNCGCEFTP